MKSLFLKNICLGDSKEGASPGIKNGDESVELEAIEDLGLFKETTMRKGYGESVKHIVNEDFSPEVAIAGRVASIFRSVNPPSGFRTRV
jgi:hypothetical protein